MNNDFDLKYRLRIICLFRPCDLEFSDYPPLMDTMFDSYVQLIQWLNCHMDLNFSEKSYKIIINTVEV